MNTDRFFANVIPEPNSGCWLWLGPTFKVRRRSMGYGRFGKRNVLAHRVSWEIHNGSADGKMVCHRCDNVLCVNPEHLFLGDARSNIEDKVAKGRQIRGEQVALTKLNEAQVLEIKASDATTAVLAKRYGVVWASIHNIRTGRTWSWLKL